MSKVGKKWERVHYGIAPDIMAAMLVIKNKRISLLWKLNTNFM